MRAQVKDVEIRPWVQYLTGSNSGDVLKFGNT